MLLGDLTGDGVHEGSDINEIIVEIAADTRRPWYDLTRDGLVEWLNRDARLVSTASLDLGSRKPRLVGDANLDGVVNVSDFRRWINRPAGPVLDSGSDRSDVELELQNPLRPLRRMESGIDHRGQRRICGPATDLASLDAALAVHSTKQFVHFEKSRAETDFSCHRAEDFVPSR